MSHLTYYNYAGFGARSRQDVHYSQAVRIDNRIEISGQGILPYIPTLVDPLMSTGGWDRQTEEYPSTIAAEVDQAFENVSVALQEAGGTGWDQVYKTRMFWISRAGLSFDVIAGEVVRNLVKHCPNHAPLLTFIEVKGLYADMRIEIEAEAHLG